MDMFPHVEMSTDYFVQAASLPTRTLFQVFAPAGAPDLGAPTPSAADQRHFAAHNGSAYEPCALASVPDNISATKLRWPYLLCAGETAQALVRVNLVTGEQVVVSTADLHGSLADPFVDYVDLLYDWALVAGLRGITMWRVGSSAAPVLFPPENPSPLPAGGDALAGHYRSTAQPVFNAVHHDTSRHLVAISHGVMGIDDGGKLLWTPDWRRYVAATDVERGEITVVLQMSDVDIIQLSVENARAAFVTRDRWGCYGLWLVCLRDFKDLDDFRRAPPRPVSLVLTLPPICLNAPLPAS